MHLLFSLIAIWFTLTPAWAAKDFSSWKKYSQGELIAETTAVAPGQPATIGLRITLVDGWHTYWINPGDSGASARFDFTSSPGIHIEQVMSPYPDRYETGPLISFGYAREVLFPITVQVAPDVQPGQTLNIVLNAEWLVCAEVCIPAVDTYKLALRVAKLEDILPGPQFSLFQVMRARVPQLSSAKVTAQTVGEHVELTLPALNSADEFVDFFPFRSSGLSNEAPHIKNSARGLLLTLNRSETPAGAPDNWGVLVLRRNGKYEAHQFGDEPLTVTQKTEQSPLQFLWMLLWAFLGGLILNLMPCVFPVLSIKLLSLLKLSRQHQQEVRAQNLAYVVGVLTSFLAIALVLAFLRSAGHFVGWGFQLQSPIFLSLLIWLFFLLSLNLLGVFEIDILNAGFGHRLTRFGGWSGSFFTGVLAVVVASPCTAPFMGVALGFGLSQSLPMLMAVFLSLGFGLAFPYFLFAIFPSWARILPKPGMWMNRVKQVMALPLLLTNLWLLWVLSQVSGEQGAVIALLGCLALGIALWIARGRQRHWLAVIFAILSLAGALAYLAREAATAATSEQVQTNDLWQPYTEKRLRELKGQRVFINATADWCLTCKVNERLIFSQADVQELLRERNVHLLKADWTQRNEEISKLLDQYNRVGVPFYVFYSSQHPGGLVLPEVLTKSSFMKLVDQAFPKP